MRKTIIIGAVLLAVLAGGVYLIWGRDGAGDMASKANQETPVTDGAATEIKTEALDLVQTSAENSAYQYTEIYSHPAYGFTFKYPEDFAISEFPSDNSEVVLIQNAAKNIGAQIVITPSDDEDVDITPEVIKEAIPSLKISEPQAIAISPERKGLAFKSDNPAFGGDSREIWFVFNHNFYQISAEAKFDEFLKGLFKTWEFAQ